MVNKQKVIPVSPQPLVHNVTAAAAKLLQPYPTLCNPIDGSLPGSPVPGILQARTLEWVAISFSNAGKRKVKGKSLSLVWLLATPWTAAYQAPPSMGFSRQEYWSGVPLPSPFLKSRGHKVDNNLFTFKENAVYKDKWNFTSNIQTNNKVVHLTNVKDMWIKETKYHYEMNFTTWGKIRNK